MGNLKLSIAMGDYDRTRPIADGRVRIDGVDPICSLLSPEEMFFRAFRHHEFDVSELSISSYSVSVANGDPHYIAIPVFLSRAFRHTSIYIRTDRGIDKPQDLKGKRIGIAEYQWSMESADDLVSAADNALYRAKQAGRNCIDLDPPAPPEASDTTS